MGHAPFASTPFTNCGLQPARAEYWCRQTLRVLSSSHDHTMRMVDLASRLEVSLNYLSQCLSQGRAEWFIRNKGYKGSPASVSISSEGLEEIQTMEEEPHV